MFSMFKKKDSNKEDIKMGKMRVEGGRLVVNKVTDNAQQTPMGLTEHKPQGFNNTKVFGAKEAVIVKEPDYNEEQEPQDLEETTPTPNDYTEEEINEYEVQRAEQEALLEQEEQERLAQQEHERLLGLYEQKKEMLRRQEIMRTQREQQVPTMQPQAQEEAHVQFIIACLDGVSYNFNVPVSNTEALLLTLKQSMTDKHVILLNNIVIDMSKVIGISPNITE